jgi:DNA mismatch repair protein MutS
VGRGTSTFDGLAVAQAVVEDLHDRVGCRTLFATHYLQLAALERLPGVANLQVLVEQHEGGLVFLHRVARGAADRSWGVHVARLAGVPEPVIDRACDLLAAFEGGATDGAATAAAPLDAPPRDSARGKRRSAPDPAAAQRTLFD